MLLKLDFSRNGVESGELNSKDESSQITFWWNSKMLELIFMLFASKHSVSVMTRSKPKLDYSTSLFIF